MREDLERAALSGTYRVLRKALRAADRELGAGETINALGSVNLDGKAAVAVATPVRLLFVSAGWFGSSTSSILLPVVGVDRGMGKLTVRTSEGARTFRVVAGGRELEQAVLNPGAGPVKGWRDGLPSLKTPTVKVAKRPVVKSPMEMLQEQLDTGKIDRAEYQRRLARMRGVK